MKVLIISGGPCSGLPDGILPTDYDLILCADKGYLHAKALGIVPHIFVGDLDSLPEDVSIQSKETFVLPPIKDMTDTQEAMTIALSRGAEHITVIGALGGRIDHTLANIHLLKFCLDRGATCELVDETSSVTLIDHPTRFLKREGFCISAIPLTKCEHVKETGVFYPLEDATMDLGNPYGVSNEFTEEYAEIDPGNGLLLVMICKSK